MGRILAIDYGKKRTGIAVSDPMQIIAGGLGTVPSHLVIKFLKDYFAKEKVDLIIIGEPKQLNNQPSENMKRVDKFKELLRKELPETEVTGVDERFTSVLAHKTMLEGGLKKSQRQNKELVDELSAVIILQSYLESKRI